MAKSSSASNHSSSNPTPSVRTRPKKTVAQILQQARAAILANQSNQNATRVAVNAGVPGAAVVNGAQASGTSPSTSTVRGAVRRTASHRAARRRMALGGGQAPDRSSLAAELGTTAPIGPAVIELLSLCYRANVPAILIGPHGVGKSEITAAAAAALKIECISRDLSLMEPPDLVGLPKIDGDATRFLPPEFLPRETGRGGFLLIEEINRAPRYMQATCLELLTSRRLNSYELPPKWLPVACINPRTEGYAVDVLDSALMSRFMQISVCASVDSWVPWARENEIHPKVIEYVQDVPHALDEAQGGSNPRSWTYASRTLKAAGAELLERSPDTIVTALSGLIGPVHTTALMRLILGTEIALKPADVLHDWHASRATMKRWKQQGRLDLLAASMRAILQWVRPEGVATELQGNVRHRGNVRAFFAMLPGDLAEQARGCLLELGYSFLIPTNPDFPT